MLPCSFEHMFVAGSFMQSGNHIEHVGHSIYEKYPYLGAYFHVYIYTIIRLLQYLQSLDME
jgi:hypothetical protein